MEDSTSFVTNASSRSKSYGHNKFQVQLQEANSRIESLESVIKEKDSELDLFKNNMRTFHLQLQDKNMEISKLQEEVSKYKQSLETITFDLNKMTIDRTSDNTTLHDKCNSLHDENLHLSNTINQMHKTQNETVEKYNNLKTKYQTTFDLLEIKCQEFSSLSSVHEQTLNELNLLKELNLKQEKDIDTVKKELFQSNNETSVLKSQLFEKDISLGELHKKLALERYKIRGKIIEQPHSQDSQPLQPTEETKDEETVHSRSIKVSQRGVKLSKR